MERCGSAHRSRRTVHSEHHHGERTGPWGAYNRSDPEYCYLLNSLDLLTFHIPFHVDHPGTILQEFGAVIVFLLVDRRLPDRWMDFHPTGGAVPTRRLLAAH